MKQKTLPQANFSFTDAKILVPILSLYGSWIPTICQSHANLAHKMKVIEGLQAKLANLQQAQEPNTNAVMFFVTHDEVDVLTNALKYLIDSAEHIFPPSPALNQFVKECLQVATYLTNTFS